MITFTVNNILTNTIAIMPTTTTHLSPRTLKKLQTLSSSCQSKSLFNQATFLRMMRERTPINSLIECLFEHNTFLEFFSCGKNLSNSEPFFVKINLILIRIAFNWIVWNSWSDLRSCFSWYSRNVQIGKLNRQT